MMSGKIIKSFVSIILTITFIFTLTFITPLSDVVAQEGNSNNSDYLLEKPPLIEKSNNYSKYLAQFSDKSISTEKYNFSAKDISDMENVNLEKNINKNSGEAAVLTDKSMISWKVKVDQDALYTMNFDYSSLGTKNIPIIAQIKIDDKIPFYEAQNVYFQRKWINESEIISDSKGNDIQPNQIEDLIWKTTALKDYHGYYESPYTFYLTAGEHILTIELKSGSVALGNLILGGYTEVPSYSEFLKSRKECGISETSGEIETIEAEKYSYKSSSSVIPTYDKASPAISPSSPKNLKLNTIGTNSNWQYPGDSISWQIKVEKTGLYKITLKARQNFTSGFFTSRKIYIDDEIQFREAGNIRFPYLDKWDNVTLGDENGDFYFYLEKGIRTLTLEAGFGEMRSVISESEALLEKCNASYRDILMLTGSEPDVYRDYKIVKQLPNLLDELKLQKESLEQIIVFFKELFTGKAGSIAALEKLSFRLEEMIAYPEKIPRGIKDFKSCLSGFGAWIISAKLQPLELDYLVIHSADKVLPKANANFFQWFYYTVASFFHSFFNDYNAIGDSTVAEASIDVWLGLGREQATILKKMIDKDFTAKNGIGVNLSLVNMANSLMPATLAGEAPDVALQIGQADIINYGLREAAEPLNGYEGFSDAMKNFRESATIPVTYQNQTYAIPEVQTFPVMFYRKDILSDLGIEKIETWDDIYSVVPQLQKKHFEFGLPVINPLTSVSAFGIFLYQNGGEFYSKDGTASLLDSEVSMEAFKSLTNFYKNYGSPQEYDFATRFRNGEMPLAIADYSMYNLISIFAPEIEGLWGFMPVPGVENKEDGTVNRLVPGAVAGCMMLSSSAKKTEAWKFMRWWTQTEVQTQYALQLEDVMGIAARYSTANVNVLKNLPWTSQELSTINRQWENVKAVPEVPGGYYTPRQIDFAWRSVVVSGKNARDTLYDYVREINSEIYSKRKEFKLPLE